MKKKYIVVYIALLVILITAIYKFTTPPSVPNSKIEISVNRNAEIKENKKPQTLNKDLFLNENNKAGTNVKAIFFNKVIKFYNLPSAIDVLENPEKWKRLAKTGDSKASIGLYFALTNCLKFNNEDSGLKEYKKISTNTDCSNFSPSDASNRLNYLQAAVNGDILAKYLYGANAWTFNSSERSKNPNSEKILEINRNALAYLEVTSDTGFVDSFFELSKAYYYGYYGSYDLPKSYGYALVANYLLVDNKTTQLVNFLEKKLRPGEKQLGSEYASSILAKLGYS